MCLAQWGVVAKNRMGFLVFSLPVVGSSGPCFVILIGVLYPSFLENATARPLLYPTGQLKRLTCGPRAATNLTTQAMSDTFRVSSAALLQCEPQGRYSRSAIAVDVIVADTLLSFRVLTTYDSLPGILFKTLHLVEPTLPILLLSMVLQNIAHQVDDAIILLLQLVLKLINVKLKQRQDAQVRVISLSWCGSNIFKLNIVPERLKLVVVDDRDDVCVKDLGIEHILRSA